jgi:hypothetical protein
MTSRPSQTLALERTSLAKGPHSGVGRTAASMGLGVCFLIADFVYSAAVFGEMELRVTVDPHLGDAAHNGIPIMGSKADDGCAARADARRGEGRAQVGY